MITAIIIAYLISCIICSALDHLQIIRDDVYFTSYANFIDELKDDYSVTKYQHPVLSKVYIVGAHILYTLTLPPVFLYDWLKGTNG